MTLTAAHILAQSSNVGAVTIGLEAGPEATSTSWVRRFGFGTPDRRRAARARQPGSCPPPKDYSGSSMGNLPIGQGLAVTPMQMAAAYSAIANGGVMHRPHVVAGQRRPGPARDLGHDRRRRWRRCSRACSPPAAPPRRRRCPATSWPARPARRRSPTRSGGYSKYKFVASFIGFAPARNPRLLVAVMVDEPTGRLLRRRGGRARVREDRLVRAALPAHPAAHDRP